MNAAAPAPGPHRAAPPLPVDEESALVAAAVQGDRAALERLLRAHQPRWWALCRRMTNADADAADALQDAMMAVVRGLPRFDGRASFGTWSYRVVTNACLDELRRRRRRPAPAPPEPVERSTDDRPTMDQAVSDRLAIDEALAALAPEFRSAVVLRDLQGLDYAEIAAVLDVPVGTVRSRISRGRAALARSLGPAVAGNPDHPPRRPSPQP